MSFIKRGINIWKKGGYRGFQKKLLDYMAGRFVNAVSPNSDRRNSNWYKYISDLDKKAEYMKATPWKLEIASTSLCNLQCIMCTHVFEKKGFGRHFDLSLVGNLKDFIAGAGQFQLMGWGEPLISPAFWKVMNIIDENKSRKEALIEISSNGAALTPHITEKILSSPLRQISFSLDAATPETYKKIRGADFEKTVSNIRHLAQRKRELGRKYPEIMLNMTLMRENIEELPAFVELAHDLGASSIQFWPLHDYDEISSDSWNVERDGWKFNYREQMLGNDAADAERANSLIELACAKASRLGIEIVWPMNARVKITPRLEKSAPQQDLMRPVSDSSAIQKEAVPQQNAAKPATHPEIVEKETQSSIPLECVAPWEWMLVDINGNVRPCCYIAQSFGNLKDRTADEIWNGEDYREMRRCLGEGKLPPQCKGAACKYVRGSRFYQNV